MLSADMTAKQDMHAMRKEDWRVMEEERLTTQISSCHLAGVLLYLNVIKLRRDVGGGSDHAYFRLPSYSLSFSRRPIFQRD